MLSVVMLSVIMLSVNMLSVISQGTIMQSVMAPLKVSKRSIFHLSFCGNSAMKG